MCDSRKTSSSPSSQQKDGDPLPPHKAKATWKPSDSTRCQAAPLRQPSGRSAPAYQSCSFSSAFGALPAKLRQKPLKNGKVPRSDPDRFPGVPPPPAAGGRQWEQEGEVPYKHLLSAMQTGRLWLKGCFEPAFARLPEAPCWPRISRTVKPAWLASLEEKRAQTGGQRCPGLQSLSNNQGQSRAEGVKWVSLHLRPHKSQEPWPWGLLVTSHPRRQERVPRKLNHQHNRPKKGGAAWDPSPL